jgi:hypothetical protein
LGKVNYLRRFICNLYGKVDAFTPLLQLKSGAEFTWGAKQQEAFDEIKSYLTSPPVLQAPKSGVPFRFYVAVEPSVIGAVLTQETDGKEYIVAYESRRLLDAETRYTFIEKLCLSLYYDCTKLRHCLLFSTCYVACQTDIIKYMLQKPILSGRVDKWAYALVEYDLRCEPICRGQPRGSLKKPGESCLKAAKNAKHKHTSNTTQNIRTQHSPRCDGPRGPPEWPNKAPPRARSASLEGSRPPSGEVYLARGLTPPTSRSASLEGSCSLERAPPRSRVPASLERALPRLRLPHERTYSRTLVRAFNALTQQSRAITRLGITPRRCSANSLG